MLELNDVSKTAIASLRCHALESRKKNPILSDPMAEYCLEILFSQASEDERELLFKRKLSKPLINHMVIRARKYDSIANDFISKHSSATVVNLGCGFDTRYWRINHDRCRYIELDLPEIIEIKRKILEGKAGYEMIACSVLDHSWIERVTSRENRHFLLLAEGLLMYLPRSGVIALFKAIAGKFERSLMVLEVVTEKYTRGIWKKIVVMKIKKELGYDAGSSYNFGIKHARELESYGRGIKVVDEWSYVEDPDTRPRFLKYLGISRTQWTVTAAINETV